MKEDTRQTNIPAVEKMAAEYAERVRLAAIQIGDRYKEPCDIVTVERVAMNTGLLPGQVVEIWAQMRKPKRKGGAK